jgi:hypothetical protein
MAHTLHVGDLVRANVNTNISDYKIGVVLEFQGQNVKIAIKNSNPSVRYTYKTVGDAFVEPLTTQMVIDDVITSDEMKAALQFKNEMEQEVNSSNNRVVSRVKGGRKKTNKKRKTNSSRSKKRRHRKSKKTHRK